MSAPSSPGPVELSIAALRRLVGIARDAGAAIMSFYGGGAAVTTKADGSPLTAADRAAHETISAALRAWDPTIPIISEEGEVPAAAERSEWRRFWLVDPLDGTKEFLTRNGEFTVNIALIEAGEPVLGVVFAPALPHCWYAGRGLGAWSEAVSAAPVRIHSAPRPSGTPLVVDAVGTPRAVSGNYPGGPADCRRQLAQVLSGGRGPGRHLSAVRDHHGVGRCGGRLHFSQFRTDRAAPIAPSI